MIIFGMWSVDIVWKGIGEFLYFDFVVKTINVVKWGLV